MDMKIKKTSRGTYKLSLKPRKYAAPQSDLKELNTMYLFDQGYTVGFRRDGKLFKFVGLRNGYEKQLELSLSSILIDRKQYISDGTKYFESMIEDNKVITHTINNISLQNKVTNNNFKNMVIVNEKFDNLEIVYEVHIKGMDIKNRLRIKEYIKNSEGQFVIGDKYNDQEFIIDRPIAYDSKGHKLSILRHNLYYENNKLYYRKTIKNNSINDNYPIYVDVNVSFEPYSYGMLYQLNSGIPVILTNWENLILTPSYALPGSGDAAHSNDQSYMYVSHRKGPDYLSCSRLFYTFDTSAILSSFNIVSANLVANAAKYSSTDTYLPKLTMTKSSQDDTLYTSTMNTNWNSILSSPTQDMTFTENQQNIIPLNSNFISDIKSSNKFKFSMRGTTYDKGLSLPVNSRYSIKLSNLTLEIEFTIDVTSNVTFNFPLSYKDKGAGYITKNSTTWSGTRSAEEDIGISDKAYVNYSGETEFLVGAIDDGSDYIINRLFLSYDTSILNYFHITSAYIKFNTFNNFSDMNISSPPSELNVPYGLQSSSSELAYSDYENTGSTELAAITGSANSYTSANLKNYIDTDSNSTFVVMHPQDFSYLPYDNTSDTSFLRIDPDTIKLEVVANAIIVIGDSTYTVENFTPAILNASTADGDTIGWYEDSSLTNPPVYVGEDYEIDKNYYDDGDILYAIAIDDATSGQTSVNVLNVALSIKKVYGQSYIFIDDSPGLFQLSASTNYPEYQIAWYSSSGLTLTSRLGVGNSILLRNDDYNYGDTVYANAIDEIGNPVAISLEIIIYKIKVYGPKLIYFQPYKIFDLKLYSSSTNLSHDYVIFYDEKLTQMIGAYNLVPGETTVTLKSTLFNDGDKIYVNLFKRFTGDYDPSIHIPLTSNSLEITLNEVVNNYNGIIARIDHRDATDIDSVYFKFHSYLDGICYTYIRDLDDPYEETLSVSDVANNGVYNMYSEYDIIDEFYNNSHTVEVSYNQNIDITKKYNSINNTLLHSSSRVLLYGQTDPTENGVYTVQSNFSLLKSSELDDNIYRYKTVVSAGENIDQEIHIVSKQVSDVFSPISNFSTSYRNISSPTSEGTPYKIGDWVGGTVHGAIRASASLSYDVIDQITISNTYTTFTVTIYDADGTSTLATNSITFNGNSVTTSSNITITVSGWTNVADGYTCDLNATIDMISILPQGGRFDVSMVWDDSEYSLLEFTDEDIFRDSETLTSTISGTLTVLTGDTVYTKYISGVKFYTLNTLWHINVDGIDNINSRSYPTTKQLGVTSTNFLISETLTANGNDNDFSGGTFTVYHDITGVTYDKTNWKTDVTNSHNWSHDSGTTKNTYATANLYDWTPSTPDYSTTSINYPYIIDTLTNTSDRKTEVFVSESTSGYPRLESDLSTPWSASTSLSIADSNTGLQILAGRLVYPQVDFSSYNTDLGIQPVYSGLTGDRYYYRLFSPLDNKFISNGVILLSDHNLLEQDLSGNTVKFDISVDSGTTWFSLNSQYTGGTLSDGNGCRIDINHYNISGATSGGTVSDSALSFTLGYAGSNNYVHLRIMISDTAKDKYIGGIQFSGGHWD